MTIKFEALQVFIKLWKALAHRLRSVVLSQQKIAICQFLGTFAPIGLLRFDESVAKSSCITRDMENKFETCYSPSSMLTN